MQIHWNEFRRDVRLSQYSVRRKEKSIIAVCISSFFFFFSFSLPLSPSLSFLSSPLALRLLCLCLPTEKEFFELIFLRRRVIFPERVFTFSSARWVHLPLFFLLHLHWSFFQFFLLHRSYPTKKDEKRRSQFFIIDYRYNTQLLYQIQDWTSWFMWKETLFLTNIPFRNYAKKS